MALSILASVLKPWPVAMIIDNVIGRRPLPSWIPATNAPMLLGAAALMILLLHFTQGLFSAGQNYLSIKAGLHGLARLRNELFGWMQRLSLAFYQRRNQGDLIYRATWDTYSLQTLFQQGLFKFLTALATVTLMVVVMLRLNVKLTLITLLIFPPLLAAMFFFGKRMNRRSLAAHQADSHVASLVQQNIASLPVVQSYTREEDEARSFGRQVQESLEKRLSQHGVEVLYWLVIAILFGVATAGLTWWGAREILAQRLTVGELVIFLSYLGQLYEPLNQLSHVGATVSDANAGLKRVFEILDTRETLAEPSTPAEFPRPLTGIAFRNVTFGYTPEKPVLRNVSFEIRAGEVIGLVGPSGAGKTTLLNLLSRFYDPDDGEVLISGMPIQAALLKDVRANVAYVFQESHLLPGTIAENIAYGCPTASRGQIEEAARLSNADVFIRSLAQGYDTLVGEAGARLSAGEKQRINIARAFLKDAPILLLDEPTSALDAETEAAVVESLGRLVANRTTIMAAHRLSTLKHASRILVLENGVITEFDSPAELLRRNSYYARIASQTGGRV